MASFGFGMNFAVKVMKGEEVKVDIPHPIEAIKEHLERKEVEKEQDKLAVMMENIDNYDGTDLGQKEIPK